MRSILCLFAIVFLTISCGKKDVNPNRNISMADFASMRVDEFAIDTNRVNDYLDILIRNDRDTLLTDYFTRKYYGRRGGLLWVSRNGLHDGADTLLAYLRDIGKIGFSRKKFKTTLLEADMHRLRCLDFDTVNTINRVLARLDYNLTKYYLRYTVGQRFGFFNPRIALNRIDLVDKERVTSGFRTLYDVQMDTPNRMFLQQALSKICNDSIPVFLREIQPSDTLYRRFLTMLNGPGLSAAYRSKVLVNMERRRWRTSLTPGMYEKYVLVNIPAFMLTAVDGCMTLNMRVGVGAFTTKTPLLNSNIYRMDLNPQWIIPKSIIRESVLRHVGDSDYFARNNYFVRDRVSGKSVPLHLVTGDMLLSPSYAVIQRGGVNNSLGRIIFRFANSFSVYLHDTSSPAFFRRANRAVSHGCVRVERPYELAVFLLDDKDDPAKARIQYSMTARLVAEEGASSPHDTLRRRMMIGTKTVAPAVPLFITYYTLYPDATGTLQEYADVYGYDAIIAYHLTNYR